jgi:hypothetical protein
MRDRESFQQFTFSGMLFDRRAATPENRFAVKEPPEY